MSEHVSIPTYVGHKFLGTHPKIHPFGSAIKIEESETPNPIVCIILHRLIVGATLEH
jgi:hypothetical protein